MKLIFAFVLLFIVFALYTRFWFACLVFFGFLAIRFLVWFFSPGPD